MLEQSSTQVDQVDIISVSVIRNEDIFADKARLHLRVRGTSLVSAKVAATKAREVAALVGQLQSVGVKAEEIEVVGVGIDIAWGSVLKTSEVNYALRVTCRSLEMMPDMLGVISSQKTAHLSNIEWQYPDEKARRDQWLDEAIAEANTKARRIAAALGVKLLGVRNFAEAFKDFEKPDMLLGADIPAFARNRTSSRKDAPMMPQSIDIGVDINHSKVVALSIHIEYRISGYMSDTTQRTDG